MGLRLMTCVLMMQVAASLDPAVIELGAGGESTCEITCARISTLEAENIDLKSKLEDLERRLSVVEVFTPSPPTTPPPPPSPLPSSPPASPPPSPLPSSPPDAPWTPFVQNAIRTGAVLALDGQDPAASSMLWPAHGTGIQGDFKLAQGVAATTQSYNPDHGHAKPTLTQGLNYGYYNFPTDSNGAMAFLMSENKHGLYGGDFAITVCATYLDQTRANTYSGILTSDDLTEEPNRQLSEMSFISNHGYPATDAWRPTGRKSTVMTSKRTPSHVCWAISQWGKQDDDAVQRIYVDGVDRGTVQFASNEDNIVLSEGYWRIGHWKGADRDDMDFNGKIFNIAVWERQLNAEEVAAMYAAQQQTINAYCVAENCVLSSIFESTNALWAADASVDGATATNWPVYHFGDDTSGNMRLVHGKGGADGSGGNCAPTHNGDHYSFPAKGGSCGGNMAYFQSEQKHKFGFTSGSYRDFAITVCSVFKDKGSDTFRGVLTSDNGMAEGGCPGKFGSMETMGCTRQGHQMSFVSSNGNPATDAWNPTGRISTVDTHDDPSPVHVCWAISSWARQDDDAVQRIYINGVDRGTSQFYNDQNDITLINGWWRIGHWNGERLDMAFTGDIYSVAVWDRQLTADEVSAVYTASL